MLFKKKPMVDVRELQKRGIVPKNPNTISHETNRQGYIDYSKKTEEKKETTQEGPGTVFGFMDNFSSPQTNSFSTETDGYSKREVDRRIEQLDNKVYKLEQRIELLERKMNIGSY